MLQNRNFTFRSKINYDSHTNLIFGHISMIKNWTTLSDDLSFKRTEFASAVYEERYIVIVGGYTGLEGKETKSSCVFDIVTHKKLALPDLPVESYWYGRCYGGILDGYFYIIDDQFGKGARIDLSSRIAWEILQSRGVKPHFISTLISDGLNLFAFCRGGDVHEYDTVTDEWVQLPSMIKVRNDFASAYHEGKIYIIGGGVHFSISSMEIYDIATQSWSTAPPLLIALDNPIAVVIGERILLTGEINSHTRNISHSFFFDIYSQSWSESSTKLFTPRIGHSYVTINDSQIISIGGKGKGYKHPMSFSIETLQTSCFKWDIIKDFVLLRELVNENRAYPVKKFTQGKYYKKRKIDCMIQSLVTDLNFDVFREILSFLI